MAGKEDEWRSISNYWRPVQRRKYTQNFFVYNTTKKYKGYQYKHFKNFSQISYARGKEYMTSKDKFCPDYYNASHSNKKISIKITKKQKEDSPWSEEAQEETRKKELSEAANKLMKKLKIWNSEKNNEPKISEDEYREKNHYGRDSSKESDKLLINQSEKKLLEDCRFKAVEVQNNISSQLKMVFKNTNSVQGVKLDHREFVINNKTSRSISKDECKNVSSKPTIHSRVESKQKIYQYLTSELMTMPKNNLKQVFIDPKVHPKFESGLAQIVKENRLLLAQKLRTLAETKINNHGEPVCSQFINDIGNLIDADFAVDVCQLPSELIKQIGDIFQLDFESGSCSNNKSRSTNINGERIIKELNSHNCSDERNIVPVKKFSSSETEMEERLLLKAEPVDTDFFPIHNRMNELSSVEVQPEQRMFVKAEPDDTHFFSTPDKMYDFNSSKSNQEETLYVENGLIDPYSLSGNAVVEQNHNYGSKCSPEYFQDFSDNCDKSQNDVSCSVRNNSCRKTYTGVEMTPVLDSWLRTDKSDKWSETKYLSNSFEALEKNSYLLNEKVTTGNFPFRENRNTNVSNQNAGFVITGSPVQFQENVKVKLNASNFITDNELCKNTSNPPNFSSYVESLISTDHRENLFNKPHSSVQEKRVVEEKSFGGVVRNNKTLNDTADVRIANEPKILLHRNNSAEEHKTQNYKQRVDTQNPSRRNTEVQTELKLIDLDYSQLPEKQNHLEDAEEHLIAEVKMIDNLLHKLNQRRFFLFLKLVNRTSCHSKQNDLKDILMQTVTNGDLELLTNLKKEKSKSLELNNSRICTTEGNQKYRKRKHPEGFINQRFTKKSEWKGDKFKSRRE